MYPVRNEVVVLIKIVEKNEMLLIRQDVTENQHAAKVLTQKGICGRVYYTALLWQKEASDIPSKFELLMFS